MSTAVSVTSSFANMSDVGTSTTLERTGIDTLTFPGQCDGSGVGAALDVVRNTFPGVYGAGGCSTACREAESWRRCASSGAEYVLLAQFPAWALPGQRRFDAEAVGLSHNNHAFL